MKKVYVILTRHALERWRQYKGNDKVDTIKKIVAKRIAGRMKKGLIIDSTNAAQVQIEDDLWATVQLTFKGWKVVTFHHGEHLKGAKNGYKRLG